MQVDFIDKAHRTVAVCVLLLGVHATGCRSTDSGLQLAGRCSTVPREEFSTAVHVMRLVSRIEPYPEDSDSYAEDHWCYVISAAHALQHLPPDLVSLALADYVTHYATAYDEEVDAVQEWSKIHLLLRVMFEVPTDHDMDRFREMGWRYGGFGFGDFDTGSAVPLSPSTPVFWNCPASVGIGEIRHLGYTYSGET